MELLDLSCIGIDATIVSCDDEGRIEWHKITNITRHDPSEHLYRIRTKWGREVSVVASKSLLVWNPETHRFEERDSEDVKIGDKLPISFQTPNVQTITSVDMRMYLPESEYLYGTDYNMNLTTFRKDFEIKDDHVYLRNCKRNCAPLMDKFELNRENGFFIGIYLAEGNTCKDYVGIANNDEEIRAKVGAWFDKQGITHRTQVKAFNPDVPGLSTSIRGYSSLLVQFLERFLGKYSDGKYIPNETYMAPDEFVEGLIDGYISGDGCITDYHVVVSSVSKELITGVSHLLTRYGIFSKVSSLQEKDKARVKNILRRYTLSIQSKYVYKFAERFTLTHRAKQEKLQKLANRKTLASMSFLYEEQNDVILDKVVSIEKVLATSSPCYEKVYDLTIPTTLNFGLANGLQVRDTSETGYIQRRLVKAMEDCKIYYDQTVRNAGGSIVQFLYGEDGMEGTKVEKQFVPTIDMDMLEMDTIYHLRPEDALQIHMHPEAFARLKKEKDWAKRCDDHFQQIVEDREYLIRDIHSGKKDVTIVYPIPFKRILKSAQDRISEAGLDGVPSNLTPGDILDEIDRLCNKLYIHTPDQGTRFLQILLRIHLSPKPMILQYHMTKETFQWIVEEIERRYYEAIAHAGEMVGIIAAQSLGEPATQLSVSGDTKIRIVGERDFSGEIAEFVDNLMAKHDRDVVDLGGDSMVLDLQGDYYVIGVSNDEKTGWRRISQVSRHPANGGLVRVTTRSGRTTTATLSHSFLKRTPLGIAPVLGSDLRVGDRVPVARTIPTVESPLRTVTLGALKRTTFALDREFGWFIGAYLADGSLGPGSVCISKMEPVFEDRVRDFGDRYGSTVSVKQDTISLFHQPLQKWMDNNFGSGLYNKHIPAWAYGCSKEFIAGIVAGYFDGDGNVYPERNMMLIHTVSETLADDLIVLMAYCGVFAQKHTEANVVQVQHKYVQHFLYTIHLALPQKREGVEKISAFNQSKPDANEQTDIIPDVCALIDSVKLRLNIPDYGKYARESIGRETLRKYIALFRSVLDLQRDSMPPSERSAVERNLRLMEQGANSDVVWDEIVELEYLPDPQTYVYDFTVPGNDSFMVDTGVLVHNTLDSFHSSGTAAAVKATSGVPRLKELLSVTKNIKTPSLRIHFKPDIGTVVNPPEKKGAGTGETESDPVAAAKARVMTLMHKFEMTSISDILEMSEIFWDPPGNTGLETGIQEDEGLLQLYRLFQRVNTQQCHSRSPWVLRMRLNREKMHAQGLTMLDVYTQIEKSHGDAIECVFSDDNADQLIFRIRIVDSKTKDIDIEDTVAALKAVEYNLVNNVILKGVEGIRKGSMRMVENKMYNPETMGFDNVAEWIMDTDGTNLEALLSNPNIDKTRTVSNDVCEIYKTLGVEAARSALAVEIQEVIRESSINYRHLSLLMDTITNKGTLMSIDRHGMNKSDLGPLAKSSFEETTNMLIDASVFSEYDRINGVSANIMLGQLPPCGTGDSEVLLDEDRFLELMRELPKRPERAEEREPVVEEIPEPCLPSEIAFQFEMPTAPGVVAQLPEPKIVFT